MIGQKAVTVNRSATMHIADKGVREAKIKLSKTRVVTEPLFSTSSISCHME